MILATAAMLCSACSDSDDDNSGNNNGNNNSQNNNGNNNQNSSINNQTNWIGAPCSCEGKGCEVASVPLPVPINKDENINGKIIGCENIDMTQVTGGALACIPSIHPDLAGMAPPTYFPQGYCSVAAVSCEGSSFCYAARYGNPDQMTACPAGSTMISAVFRYPIMGDDSIIVEKMCTKTCKSDDDCNKAGEISCIKRNDKDGKEHNFCYNEKNYKFLCSDDACSNINYIGF